MSDDDTQSETDEQESYVEVVDDESNLDSSLSVYARTDRERAMLTKTDRELLLGEKEYDSDQALRNARHRLREHIRNSLLDAYTVSTLIEADELRQIVERQNKLGEEDGGNRVQISSGVLKLAIQLMYVEANQEYDRSFIEHVESEVARTVSSVLERESNSIVTEIDVDISVTERGDADEIINDIVHGNPTMSAITKYLLNFGSNHIQKTLREEDTVIETAEGIVIGPHHEIFDSFEESGKLYQE